MPAAVKKAREAKGIAVKKWRKLQPWPARLYAPSPRLKELNTSKGVFSADSVRPPFLNGMGWLLWAEGFARTHKWWNVRCTACMYVCVYMHLHVYILAYV